ncbi:MAG TPA: RNA polymerase sigma factor [Thermoanaerobaculia bacterium]|jgi:RNA polymerase sigma-70 factor (ECF subfamily)
MTTAQATTTPLPEQLTDEQVVTRVVAGDAAQFEILMRRHNQRIYRTVRAVLRSEDEVEDVMQQAYLNAYTHLSQFGGQAQFSTWLTRIAINEALARRGKRGKAFGEGEDAVMLSLVDTKTRNPEQQAAASEMRQVLEHEIAELPDSYRLTFMMRDVEGLTTAETAESLGISEDLVKTRLHRARTMLRDNLYRRAGVTLESIFTFGNARCDRVVGAVMSQIVRE